MVDIGYLKKLIDSLQEADPYSNIYSAWAFTLRNLEGKLNELGDKIRKEVAKFIK